jgi:hypothetical protein
LIISGGGHQNYAGNEIYVFSVPHLKFSRIWGPSRNADIVNDRFPHEVYLDGNPGARETYWGLAHAEVSDNLFMIGGSLFADGSGSTRCWLFDLKTRNWQTSLRFIRNRTLGVMAHYDPITRHVFVFGGGSIEEFDPVSKTIVSAQNIPDSVSYIASSVIMPDKRKIFLWEVGNVKIFDLMTRKVSVPTITGQTRFFLSPSRDATNNFYYAGTVYVQPLNKIVVWDGGGSASQFGGALYAIDPDTWVSKKLSVGGLPPKGTVNGMYGRMQYIPSKKVLVFLTDVFQNVRLIKLLP